MKEIIKCIISESDLNRCVNRMAKEIIEYYKFLKNKLVLIGLLKGSFIFMADLCRKIHIPHEVDFMTVSSYGNSKRSKGDIKIIKDLDEDIRKKNVLIVEDIIDSGNTLKKIKKILKLRNPNSIDICTLLDKPSRREVDIYVKWIGYKIKDEFIVGYGIDYAQKYRHLPYIGNLVLIDS